MTYDLVEMELAPKVGDQYLRELTKQVTEAIEKAQDEVARRPGKFKQFAAGLVGAGKDKASEINKGGLSGIAGMASGGFGAITGFAEQLSKYVSKFNPAIVEQFDAALEDISGVIGQALAPAFDVLTPLVRMMGDFLKTILPNFEEMKSAVQVISPALGVLRTGLEYLAKAIKWCADVITAAAESAAGVESRFMTDEQAAKNRADLESAIKAKGAEGTDSAAAARKQLEAYIESKSIGGMPGGLSSSVGAASRGATSSSFLEAGKSLQLGALSIGVTDPAKQTAENTKRLVTNTDIIAGSMKGGLKMANKKGFTDGA